MRLMMGHHGDMDADILCTSHGKISADTQMVKPLYISPEQVCNREHYRIFHHDHLPQI